LDFDIALTGFDEGEIDALLAESTPQGNTDEDEVPEEPEDPVTRIGDVWLLGRHRVRCGDSTSADDVAALLNGVEPHLMVTDPPYGVNYDADWRNHTGNMARSARAIGKVQNDDRVDWSEAWALFPGDVAYIWHAGNKANTVADSLIKCGFKMRAQIIWAKNNIVISRGDYHPKHEPCWYAVKGKGHWQGSRKESTLWQIDKLMKSETGHSTQKPVECMRRPIVNNSAPGQPVYDPFLGSGTTLIAGETEGRPVYGMEIDPKYCDVIVTRWQEFTGKDAVLESSGQTFNEVQNGRKTQKSND
jgi:DNA modification methylase